LDLFGNAVFLKSLELRQFRNFTRLQLLPAPGLNVLVGSNGAGKSNILESVAVVATGQSHRGAEPRHLLQEGKDEMAVVAELEGEEPIALEIRQKRGRMRQVKLNNRPQGRLRDWGGRVPVVAFSPEDLELIKGEPGVRRRALNAVLTQVSSEYAEALARYQKILEERNATLRRIREGGARASALEPWDLVLLKEGARLTMARQRFLSDFSGRVQRRQRDFSVGRDRGTLMYRPSFHLPSESEDEVSEANRRRLGDLREGEIALGSTLIGPHRDEVEFRLDDEPAKTRASQGQIRTLALAWKWEERLFLRERLAREPLCLLDDVFSELDPERRHHLTELLMTGVQAFITLTDLSTWGAYGLGEARVFEVREGQVEQPSMIGEPQVEPL
jgi:DNA replication and repair protein RecF